MNIADQYISLLSEAVYLSVRSGRLDSKGRWLAQSFLRNGVGASLDIAVGPNPPVNLLDLLVLVSLQSWTFEKHWIPAGIGDPGLLSLERLKKAETEVWTSARSILSEDQMVVLRGLIDSWIAENPDRTVVSLVRFNEFADERRISSLSLRRKAEGLLKSVSEASTAVDEARLLGERLLWFAGRYPYLLGEQTELTAYRLMDQPEGTQLLDTLQSLQRLSEVLGDRIGTLQSDLDVQQEAFFSRFSAERKETITQLFDRVAQERRQLLDDISSRDNDLSTMLVELRDTISVSANLARELTKTVEAIDSVVSRFDTDPDSDREPIKIVDIRDAAIETGKAADQLTVLIERTIELLESRSLDKNMTSLSDLPESFVDQIFWRAVILICLLLTGIGFLRLIPQRNRKMKKPVDTV